MGTQAAGASSGGRGAGGGTHPLGSRPHGAQTGAKLLGVSVVKKQAHVLNVLNGRLFLHLQLLCCQFYSGAGVPLFNKTLIVHKSSDFFLKTIQCLCEGRTH